MLPITIYKIKKKGKSYEGIRPPPAKSPCVIANKSDLARS